MSNSPLSYISLEGFRSIHSLSKLDLNHGLNVLIGGNGAGKSNFISFFQMLGEMMDPNLGLQNYIAEKGGADVLLFRGIETTDVFSATLNFNLNHYKFSLKAADDGRMFFSNETISFKGPYHGTSNYSQGTGHFESGFNKSEGNSKAAENWTADAIRDWRVYHFHNTSKTAALMRPVNAVDNETLWKDAGNIAAFLLKLQQEHPKHYNRIILHIRQAAPFFGDFVLKQNSAGQVILLWKEKHSPKVYYPHQLSDGTIRFICLATLLLQPEPPSTIIIDEPELGLHPSAITALAGMLRLAEEKSQLIVSTQSSPLVDHLQLEDLIIVDRVEGATTLNKLKPESLKEWINDYSLGQLWDKNLLGGMPQS